jgi:hypothetical protein
MKRQSLRAVLLGAWMLWFVVACAQSPWEGVFMPGLQHGAERRLYADQEHNTVYAFGLIRFDNTTAQHSAILAWRNNQWDTVLYDVGFMQHVIVYHDTLFVAGGLFSSIQGVPMGNMAYLANGEWHSSPVAINQPGIERFRIIEDTLYACMGQGAASSPVYRWIGDEWQPFGDSVPWVACMDIIKYNGEFYGALHQVPDLEVVSKLVNGVWVGLSDQLIGNFSTAQNLIEYQGYLYIGGQLSMNEGLPGQGIIRYDGNTFHSLGAGLQTYLTNNNGWCGAADMVISNGFLCVLTSCNYAGGVPVNGVALWDGQQWCSMPGEPFETGGQKSITSLNDTLYVTCGETIAGEPVGYMARFVGPDLTEECALVTEVPEHMTGAALTISTTTDHMVLITGLKDDQHPYALYDAQGRTVAQGVVRATAGQARISLPDVVPALYVLRIADHAAQVLQLPNR